MNSDRVTCSQSACTSGVAEAVPGCGLVGGADAARARPPEAATEMDNTQRATPGSKRLNETCFMKHLWNKRNNGRQASVNPRPDPPFGHFRPGCHGSHHRPPRHML